MKKDSRTLIRTVTHISLGEANVGKLAALNTLWDVYKALCQEYVTWFCTQAEPDPHVDFVFRSELSARWQRVAVQQAAGMAQSWRTKHRAAQHEYGERLAYYQTLSAEQQATRTAPVWKDWHTPVLQAVCIQANANVVLRVSEDYPPLALEANQKGHYDYWLRVSTLDKGKPIYLPVKLANYHRKALGELAPNCSVTLNRDSGKWWLTLSVTTPRPEPNAAPCGKVGLDVGICNFVTDSIGQRFGGVETHFINKVQWIQGKQARKAKLRACLQKKGVTKLPSTSSAVSQRLGRQVRQDINRAVNLALDAHPNKVIVVEALSVATMRFKARRMNAYLKASNLGHILKQLDWTAAKRGIPIVSVPAAYSSQECPHCHFADRANRPSQQTFCCQVCDYADHADVVAARNLESRLDDEPLCACRSKEAVKHLLDQRHQLWHTQNGYP